MPATSSSPPPFTAAVLTGGASRRMGSDKALVDVGGRPLAAVVAGALVAAGARVVLAVGGDGAALSRHGLVAVADDYPGEGPLGGVLTALHHAGDELVVVLACDLVHAAPGAVQHVVAALAAAPDAVAAVPVVDGQVEPMHAAWRRAALPAMRASFAGGERSVHRALEGLASHGLGVIPVFGLDRVAVADVDDPDELASARVVARRHHGPDWHAMSDGSPPEIDVDRLAELEAEGAWILDVRQTEEYEQGHVPGAHLIPLDQLSARHSEVPTDREVFVVCASGGRSAAATEALNGAGYRAVNVSGGTLAWMKAGHPLATGSGSR